MFNTIKNFIQDNALACVAVASGAALGSGTYAVIQHRRANRIAKNLAAITSEMQNTIKAAKEESKEDDKADAQTEDVSETSDSSAQPEAKAA